MRDDYKEQLSALLDDELRPEESRFLLARVGEDAEARRQLGQYVLIRDALHQSLPSGDRGLSSRVASALAEEPAHDPRLNRGAWQRVLRPVAGVAVAASVALVTIGLWPSPDPRGEGTMTAASTGPMTPPAGSESAPLASSTAVSPAPEQGVSEDGRRWDRLEPDVKQRLNSYLVNHSEHSSAGRFGGVLPYVRIAGHGSNDE